MCYKLLEGRREQGLNPLRLYFSSNNVHITQPCELPLSTAITRRNCKKSVDRCAFLTENPFKKHGIVNIYRPFFEKVAKMIRNLIRKNKEFKYNYKLYIYSLNTIIFVYLACGLYRYTSFSKLQNLKHICFGINRV